MTILTSVSRGFKPFTYVFPLVLLIASAFFATFAQARTDGESTFWIEVESQTSIRDTKARAQVFARDIPDTKAFQTKTGTYAIVIGPLSEGAAGQELENLKATGQISTQSFVSDGAAYLNQLWPISANTDIVIATADDGNTREAVIADADQGPIPDPDIAATRELERSWSRAQKQALQTYMVWTGDYKSAIDGIYGAGTRKAIKAFQTREGFQDTGFLTQAQADLLTQIFEDTSRVLGMANLRDLDAGIEMRYPQNLVEFDRLEPPFVHYKAKPGSKARMMLISQVGGRAELNSLYEIMETLDYIPPDGYRVKKRDWFVLSGRDDKVVSYTYVRTDKKTVKGFTIIWLPEQKDTLQAMATEMYGSFSTMGAYVLDDSLPTDTDKTEPLDLAEGLETPAPDHQASGFFVNRKGVVVTNSSNITGCSRVSINEGSVVLKLLAENTALSLAALGPIAEFTPRSYALFSDEALELGADISVAGFAFPDVMDIAALNYGTLTDTKGRVGGAGEIRLTAFLEDGDTGGPVLDDRGAVIAMQLAKSGLETDEPSYVNYALRAGEITKLLQAAGIDFGTSTSIDALPDVDLAFAAGDFTVKVACWK